jgi:predicted transcriptional regulator YdeE
MEANKDKGTSVGFSDWQSYGQDNFKITENLEQINKQQWEDIWRDWWDSLLHNAPDAETLFEYLKENYFCPEKKNI